MDEHNQSQASTLKVLLLRWAPVVLWAVVIFLLSNTPDPYGYIPKGILRWIWWTKLFGYSMIYILGLAAHFLEYAVLSFLLARAVMWDGGVQRNRFILVFALTLLYAVSDEIHQIFTPGRAFQLVDLLMDALGSLIGLAAYLLWIKRLRYPVVR